MDELTRQRLLEKNQRLINMVIERAKRDFPDDIAIIGLTGSFSTNDFHEKSDLDLIIINNTDAGWQIAEAFIFDDVGYDIYCTPWGTRIAAEARLESPAVSSLTELKILYCAKPEYMDRFNQYRQKALAALAEPIGKECIQRARKHIDKAKQNYADAYIHSELGAVRLASAELAYNLVNAIVNLNNTCIKRGVRRYFEELSSYAYLPQDFEAHTMALIEARTAAEIRSEMLELLKSVVCLCDEMCVKFVARPTPSYDNLWGTYEELWSNCRNKVINSTGLNDKAYAFFVALSAQNYLDEMTAENGTPRFELMRYFDADNLEGFKAAFMRAMGEYLREYEKVGRSVLKFDTFEALYSYYMRQ